MAGLAAGDLNRRIAIHRAMPVDDGTATVTELVEIGKRWASKRDVRDAEKFAGGELAASLASRFVVRADSLTRTIDARDAIVCDGRTYHVVGTKEVGDRAEGIEITTSSRGDQS